MFLQDTRVRSTALVIEEDKGKTEALSLALVLYRNIEHL